MVPYFALVPIGVTVDNIADTVIADGFRTVEEICGKLLSPSLDGERAILLFSNPGDALRSLQAGLSCSSVNLGGLHFVPGKMKIMDVCAVNDADLEALKAILRRGVKIDIQTVPTEKPQPLEKVFKACLGEAGAK